MTGLELKRLLKSLCEASLVRSGVADARLQARRSSFLILAFHNIIPDGVPASGDTSLHLSCRRFVQFLEFLGEHLDVIPLRSVLAEVLPGQRRARLAVTFDDAYGGAVTLGVRELESRGLPATFFVPPALLGRRSFWWDEFVGHGETRLDPEFRRRALEEWKGRGADIRRRATEQRLPRQALDEHLRSATHEEVLSAARLSGITVASHSLSHPNLSCLPTKELKKELSDSLAWLSGVPSAIPWLSYPYGLESRAAAEEAERCGYEAAVRVKGGWCDDASRNRFSIPRLNIRSDLSLDGFILRIAGVLRP